MRGPQNKTSLDRLKLRVADFRILTAGALKLAPARCRLPNVLQDLDVIHECASGLYNALRDGWQCECDRAHPANIELKVWSPGETTTNSVMQLKFSFLFADDAQRAVSDHWMTAEITTSKKAATREQPGVHSMYTLLNQRFNVD